MLGKQNNLGNVGFGHDRLRIWGRDAGQFSCVTGISLQRDKVVDRQNWHAVFMRLVAPVAGITAGLNWLGGPPKRFDG